MSACLRTLVASTVCALLLGAPRISRADAASEAVHIEYSAPSGCPANEAFLSQVKARTTRALFAAESARTFVIAIARTPGEATGRLVIREAEGKETDREVTGDTCEEVVAALALITALAIDPSARTDDRPSDAEVIKPSPDPPRERPPSPRLKWRDSRWQLALSAGAAAVSGVSPRFIYGVPVELEATAPGAPGAIFVPALRLGFERAGSGAIDRGPGTARFTWTVGLAEACPLRLRYATFSATPCARLEAGVLEASGADVEVARGDTRGWLAAGLIGRARWLFLAPVFLDLGAGIRFPFIRTRYLFEPNTTIYRPAAAGWLVSERSSRKATVRRPQSSASGSSPPIRTARTRGAFAFSWRPREPLPRRVRICDRRPSPRTSS